MTMRRGTPGIGVRAIEQGYPIRTALTKRSRSRILTASLLWHKHHTMPEPAFALFFFYFHSFVTSPALYGRGSRFGETPLPTPLHNSSVRVARHYTRVNTTLSPRLSISLALAQLLSPFLSFPLARPVTPSHNSLLSTRAIPLPTSLYDQLCYISKI